MSSHRSLIHSSEELLIQRWANGIRLIKSSQLPYQDPVFTIKDMLELPLNFYFTDTNSVIQNINEQTAITCGYGSRQDAIGKSVLNISNKETARIVIENDQKVIKTKSLIIEDEKLTKLDNTDLDAISIKFPWFENNKVIGVLGCSILMNFEGALPVSDSLSLLIQTGLLSPSRINSSLPGKQFGKAYLDKRDMDILYLLTRGKTAKNIAKMIGLSHRTVEHRLEKIKIKMGISSKSELIEKVIDYFM